MITQGCSIESYCHHRPPGAVTARLAAFRLLTFARDPGIGRCFSRLVFCLLGGAFLLIPCHILITRKGWQPRFSLVFSYVALMFLFATLLWFLFLFTDRL